MKVSCLSRNRIFEGKKPPTAQEGDIFIDDKKQAYIFLSGKWQKLCKETSATQAVKVPMDILNDGSCYAYYPFEGNVNDIGGKFNGTWHGKPAYGDGIVGKAALFTGDGSYIEFDKYAAQLAKDLKAISFWFNPDKEQYVNPSYNYVTLIHIDTGDGCHKEGFQIRLNSPKPQYSIWIISDFGKKSFYETPVTSPNYWFDANKWYHIHINLFGDKMLYINGKAIQTIRQPNKEFYNVTAFWLGLLRYTCNGADPTSMGRYRGFIDQLRLFNRPLNQGEVRKVYEAELKVHQNTQP